MPPIPKRSVPLISESLRQRVIANERQLTLISDALRHSMAQSGTFPSLVVTEKIKADLARLAEQIEAIFAPLRPALVDFAADLRRSLPDNWVELDADEMMVAVEIGRDGLCLVWAPRAEIVRAIISAKPKDREQVLLEHADDVTLDMLSCCAATRLDELKCECQLLEEALRTFQAGYPAAAQALTTSVLTSLLDVAFPRQSFQQISNRADTREIEKWPLRTVRLGTIYAALAVALEHFDRRSLSKVPSRFNRHHTAHRVTAGQFTTANCLGALLLATALARELSVRLAAHGQAA